MGWLKERIFTPSNREARCCNGVVAAILAGHADRLRVELLASGWSASAT